MYLSERAAQPLVIATVSVVGFTLLLPFTPLASPLGFVALRPFVLMAMAFIVMIYVVSVEVAKIAFYRREERARRQPERSRLFKCSSAP